MYQERSILLFSSEISKELKMGLLMGKPSEDNSEVLKMGYSWASKVKQREYISQYAREWDFLTVTTTLRSLMNRLKWSLMPLRNSWTKSLLWQGMCVASRIAEPNFGSATPTLNLAFLVTLTLGKFNSRKLCKSCVNIPAQSNQAQNNRDAIPHTHGNFHTWA